MNLRCTYEALVFMRTLSERLKPILDRRAKDERDIVPKVVEGRNSDGTLRLRPQTGECVLRGSVGAESTGQVIWEPPAPTFDRRGLSGSTVSASSAGGLTVWVERLEPSDLPRGKTLSVIVHGRGFTADTELEFGEPGPDFFINPEVRILKQTLLDSERIELEVQILETARLTANAPILYDS